jgi:hypothetical protein
MQKIFQESWQNAVHVLANGKSMPKKPKKKGGKKERKKVGEGLRRRAKQGQEESRRLEQQRAQTEKARKEEDARRAAAPESERRAGRQNASQMAILTCKHAYDAACISRKFQETCPDDDLHR